MAENATEKKSITPAQRKAIETMMISGSMTQAAADAGVNRSTLYKWGKDEAFVAALREAEAEAIQGLSRNLVTLSRAATAALAAALSPNEKTSTRLRAAEIVISNLLRVRELVDIETRLQALEEGRHEKQT